MSILSDSSKQSLVARKRGWADLDLALTLHPIRKDIIPLRDTAAIKNAVRNLLQSNFYERPFQSTCGANLRGLLFEPNDVITRIVMREGIKEVLAVYEPRIRLHALYIDETAQGNGFKITVVFRIKENSQPQEVELVLRRLR
jgi:phage baseplate assembly protein W